MSEKNRMLKRCHVPQGFVVLMQLMFGLPSKQEFCSTWIYMYQWALNINWLYLQMCTTYMYMYSRLTLFFGFRDSRHEIRALCIAEMGEWMKEYRLKPKRITKNLKILIKIDGNNIHVQNLYQFCILFTQVWGPGEYCPKLLTYIIDWAEWGLN